MARINVDSITQRVLVDLAYEGPNTRNELATRLDVDADRMRHCVQNLVKLKRIEGTLIMIDSQACKLYTVTALGWAYLQRDPPPVPLPAPKVRVKEVVGRVPNSVFDMARFA
jgi:hypothetical protein